MRDLFIDELKDMLSAEQQIIKALPDMVKAAESPALKKAYSEHLKETKGQVVRLKKIFKIVKAPATPKFSGATHGLIAECKSVIKEFEKSPVRDAALISKAQRIEHYEISAYGTLRAFATELKLYEVAELLRATETEEAHADKTMTGIAEGGLFRAGVNHEANFVIVKKKATTKKVPAKKKKVPAKRTKR